MNVTLPVEDVRWLLRHLKHNEFSHDFIKDEQRCELCQRIKAITKKMPPRIVTGSNVSTRRWDEAAQQATDEGKRPGSSEFYRRIREILRGEPA